MPCGQLVAGSKFLRVCRELLGGCVPTHALLCVSLLAHCKGAKKGRDCRDVNGARCRGVIPYRTRPLLLRGSVPSLQC